MPLISFKDEYDPTMVNFYGEIFIGSPDKE